MAEKKVGEVTHYFTDIEVAGIELIDTLEVGDTIHVEGTTTDFEQTVGSMQVEGDDVESADVGTEIGIKVDSRVRVGDTVYKVE